jgi:hypothetical protein
MVTANSIVFHRPKITKLRDGSVRVENWKPGTLIQIPKAISRDPDIGVLVLKSFLPYDLVYYNDFSDRDADAFFIRREPRSPSNGHAEA